MPLNICHDHLYGFDSNYFSPQLSEVAPGKVQVEYIVPDHLRLRYPQLEIQFSAFLMIQNNHFGKFLHIKQSDPVDARERTNFLCSFNRSKHNCRVQFLLNLFTEGFYSSEFCSKHFTISDSEWLDFVKNAPDEIKDKFSLSSIFKFLQTDVRHGVFPVPNNQIGYISKDLKDLTPLMQKSFITAVSETVAGSYIPFPTEKICFPIATKSLWIAYAQPGYYQFIERYMGIKLPLGIDYYFDSVQDPTQRLHALMNELKKLSQLGEHQKVELYELNRDILDYNFDLLTSGEMIANLWRHDECQEHYQDFVNLAKMSDLSHSNLINQWAQAMKFFTKR
jgi:hypothetical protein